MRSEDISDALDMLDEDMLRHAEAAREKREAENRTAIGERGMKGCKKAGWKKWCAAAACLCIVCGIAMGLPLALHHGEEQGSTSGEVPGKERPQHLESEKDHMEELPMLAVTENAWDGMGFEGFWAYDASELVDENPWSGDAGILSLPVYRNKLTCESAYQVTGGDFNAMKEFLLEIAGRLGMDTEHLEITDNTPDKKEQEAVLEKLDGNIPEGYFDPTAVVARADGVEIEVDIAMTATVSFEPPVSLPQEYHFKHHASYGDIQEVSTYLKEAYGDLIGMDNPRVNIHGGGYDTSFRQSYDIEFYNKDGEITSEIINYNFNRVSFSCDDDGKLMLVRIYHPDLSDKSGDYPVIPVNEASRLLAAGHYITSVPYEMPGAEYIARTELVYRTGDREAYYMPYYRFYVELPEDDWQPGSLKDKGLKSYGAYYVPAVDGKYISNMPLWDGGFN